MQHKGLDIRPHRERMVKEDLETRFKKAEDPFRMVFVCAMWMTGFDVPSCSTIYLDKPMRKPHPDAGIARANRVYGDKIAGLIVDYIGIFRDLQRALAILWFLCGGGIQPGESPWRPKMLWWRIWRRRYAHAVNSSATLGLNWMPSRSPKVPARQAIG